MEAEELFALELARLWVEERVSCPHRNLLQGYLEGRGSIEAGAREFVAFHVEALGCPTCRVEIEDLKAAAAATPPPARAPAVPPPPAGTARRLLTETQLRERGPRRGGE